jgi:hypothetical protein
VQDWEFRAPFHNRSLTKRIFDGIRATEQEAADIQNCFSSDCLSRDRQPNPIYMLIGCRAGTYSEFRFFSRLFSVPNCRTDGSFMPAVIFARGVLGSVTLVMCVYLPHSRRRRFASILKDVVLQTEPRVLTRSFVKSVEQKTWLRSC